MSVAIRIVIVVLGLIIAGVYLMLFIDERPWS